MYPGMSAVTVEDVQTGTWLDQPRRTRGYQRRPHLYVADSLRSVCARAARPRKPRDLGHGVEVDGATVRPRECMLCLRIAQAANLAVADHAAEVELPSEVSRFFDALSALGGVPIQLVPTNVRGTDDAGVAHFDVDTTRTIPADMVATMLRPLLRTATRVRFHS
jgi:hypothetical protein